MFGGALAEMFRHCIARDGLEAPQVTEGALGEGLWADRMVHVHVRGVDAREGGAALPLAEEPALDRLLAELAWDEAIACSFEVLVGGHVPGHALPPEGACTRGGAVGIANRLLLARLDLHGRLGGSGHTHVNNVFVVQTAGRAACNSAESERFACELLQDAAGSRILIFADISYYLPRSQEI